MQDTRQNDLEDQAVAGEWPLTASFEMAPVAAAVPAARHVAARVLAAWGRSAATDRAGLVVSELMTNAVAATRTARLGCPVRLSLRAAGGLLLIGVADCSPLPPLLADSDFDSEAGRGLWLVEAVCGRWGWHPGEPAPMAKIVWAELETGWPGRAGAGSLAGPGVPRVS